MSASDRGVAPCRVALDDAMFAAEVGVDFMDPRAGELVCSCFVNISFVLSLIGSFVGFEAAVAAPAWQGSE